MISEVYNCDCIRYMKTIPNGYFDLVIADPPYGLDKKSVQGSGKLKGRTMNRHDMSWDVQPPQDFWKELFRVSKNQIIWGGNYFSLPPCRCFVCWDKQQVWENFSQCEFAWTSFDKPAKLVTISNRGGKNDINWHPTSKPVKLYSFLLEIFAKAGDRIFDPMLGSQASRIAAYNKGLDFYGCEINEDYYNRGNERFNRECKGIYKTKHGTYIEQDLFT